MSDYNKSKCHICGETETFKVANKNYYLDGLKVQIKQEYLICSRCGFLFTADPPSKKFLEKYYNTSFQERSGFADSSEKRHVRDQVHFLKSSMGVFSGPILEIGPNHGEFLDELRKIGTHKLYYSELNERAARILKARGYTDFDSMKSKRGSVSLIVLMHTLEHVVDPRHFIARLVSYLSENGHLYIEVPDFSRHDKNTDSLLFEHVNYFGKFSLHYLLFSCGLDIISIESDTDALYTACPRRIVRIIAQKSNTIPNTSQKRIDAIRKTISRENLFFEKLDDFLFKVKRGERIGIYTAGLLARESLRKTRLGSKTVVGIFDRDKSKWGKKVGGVNIMSPEEIKKFNIKYLLVLNEGYENQIRKDLGKSKFPKATFYSDIMKL
ncbi:MAG: methyltransferase domain-containing protein [Patescibacteria group bacterium]